MCGFATFEHFLDPPGFRFLKTPYLSALGRRFLLKVAKTGGCFQAGNEAPEAGWPGS